MKKIILALALTTLGHTVANAEEIWFLETPEFYQTSTYQYPCDTRRASDGIVHYRIATCLHPELDDTRFKAVNTDGDTVWVDTMDAVAGECSKGICEMRGDRYVDGTYIGRADGYVMLRHLTPGYYVHEESDGSVWAYRFGSGPLEHQFGAWYIENEVLPPASWEVYDVTCVPGADHCEMDGEIYTPRELMGIIPLADVDSERGPNHHCPLELCINAEGQTIGLNPFFYSMYE